MPISKTQPLMVCPQDIPSQFNSRINVWLITKKIRKIKLVKLSHLLLVKEFLLKSRKQDITESPPMTAILSNKMLEVVVSTDCRIPLLIFLKVSRKVLNSNSLRFFNKTRNKQYLFPKMISRIK